MIYCVIEFDHDGKYSGVSAYVTTEGASGKFAEIYSHGGEAKIVHLEIGD